MERRAARQIGALAEDDVVPAEAGQPVEDRGPAYAASDDHRTGSIAHGRNLNGRTSPRTGFVCAVMKAAAAVALVALCLPGAAGADGPFFNDSGGLHGILASSGYRYVTVGERNVDLLMRIAPDLHVAAERPLPGSYTIPAVAMDRTTAGLSADGKTLVLVQPRSRWGRERTKFLLMSLPGMHIQAAVTLRGDFTFDAMSPDASRLYFMQYLSKDDPTRYQVRAFDTSTGRLVRDAIVDRSEPDEEMRGYPLSRVTSADGRFAYTL